MGKLSFFDNVRRFISNVSFSVFLWASRLSADQYWARIEIDALNSCNCTCEEVEKDKLMKWDRDCPIHGAYRQQLEREAA